MKTSLKQYRVNSRRPWTRARGFPPTFSALILSLVILGWPGGLQAQIDNFDDGNDNLPPPGWTRYDPIASSPLGPIATYSFPNGGYRIRTSPSPAPGVVGPGRAGSLRPDVVYTNFYITVDVLDWDGDLDQAFGIVARVAQVGLGTTDGYAMTYTASDQDLDIVRFVNEDPSGDGGDTLATADLTINSGQAYRFVFSGSGPVLTAKVFALPDTTTPLASVSVTDLDPTYYFPSGIAGLINYDNSDGEVGYTDVTYDNYSATDIEPPRLTIAIDSWGDVNVTWPPPGAVYALEKASSVTATVWDTVPEAEIRFVDGLNIYTEVPSDPSTPVHFFRLRRQ